jgi:hypothetical protein
MCNVQARNEMGPKNTPQHAFVKLLYSGPAEAHVRGNVTGQVYRFSHFEPILPVDERDAVQMLQNRFLRPTN